MKRQHASVVLVFGGFVVLVLVFRGVWGNAWHALIGGGRPASTSGGGSASAPNRLATRPIVLQPGSFNLEYPTPAAGLLPGSAPVPARAAAAPVIRHPLITGTGGDRAGAPGENRWTANTLEELKAKGGNWALHAGWQGPGVYEAQKFTDPFHGYTTGTEIVKVG